MKTPPKHPHNFSTEITARRDFDQALRDARMHAFWDRLLGRESKLIPFGYLQQIVEMTNQRYRGIQAVPIAQIIGSVERSGDFNRVFAPIQIHSRSKWLSIDAANLRGVSLPPISLYKVGDAYFVVDGHHRVSVAQHLGQTFIDAEVTEVQSRVPVSAHLDIQDIDLLGPYHHFLAETGLDKLRPGVSIEATRPEYYTRLLDHIRGHQYFIGLESNRAVPWEEAVADWYDNTYLPIIRAIHRHRLLRDFNQTETDLYLGIIDHAYYLSKRLGHNIRPDLAALDFASRFSRRPGRVLARIWLALRDRFIPDRFEPGPQAGIWRKERLEQDDARGLFRDILITVSGAETGWLALSQAAEIARRENGILHGLHVLPNDDPAVREAAQRIMDEFTFRCTSLQVPFTTSLAVGDVEQTIIEWARWSDLVVINQRREHGEWADVPLGTIFHGVAEKAARPILAVPGTSVCTPKRLLLAYDGSPKSREALFVMRELLSRWQAEGVILTVAGPRTSTELLDNAWQYVGQKAASPVQARFEAGDAHQVILRVMREEQASLLIMGGYGYQPLIKAFLGSTVDRVLREAWFPVLICR